MLIVAFGESTMSKTRVYKCTYISKRTGSEEDRSGDVLKHQQSAKTSNMILQNRRITIRKVADDVGISFVSCQAIFLDVLDIKHVKGIAE